MPTWISRLHLITRNGPLGPIANNAGGICKRRYIQVSTVRPTLHTNPPSRLREMTKMWLYFIGSSIVCYWPIRKRVRTTCLSLWYKLSRWVVILSQAVRRVIVVFTTFLLFFILGEIDLFEAFNIDTKTKGFTQVQGLATEFSIAYKIGKSMPRIEQSSHVLDEIKNFLIKERRLVFIANVKIKDFSFGTLFSVESKSRGMEL